MTSPLVEPQGLHRLSKVLVSCTQSPCLLNLSFEKRFTNEAKPELIPRVFRPPARRGE